jgi:hypothetical protein
MTFQYKLQEQTDNEGQKQVIKVKSMVKLGAFSTSQKSHLLKGMLKIMSP